MKGDKGKGVMKGNGVQDSQHPSTLGSAPDAMSIDLTQSTSLSWHKASHIKLLQGTSAYTSLGRVAMYK